MTPTPAEVEAARVAAVNAYPAARIDFVQFVDVAALSDDKEQPVTFTVVNDTTSHTRRRYTLTWPSHDGQLHTVTSPTFHELMWQAAITDRLIWDDWKANRHGDAEPAPLPLFERMNDVGPVAPT